MDSNENPLPPQFTPPPLQPIAPKRSRMGMLLAFGCGGCAIVACLGVAFATWFFMSFGMTVLAEQVRADLQDNAVVIQHLGRIENFEVDMMSSISSNDEDEFIFRAEGTLDSGVITAICITVDGDTEQVISGTLQVSDGTIHNLFPAGGPTPEKE